MTVRIAKAYFNLDLQQNNKEQRCKNPWLECEHTHEICIFRFTAGFYLTREIKAKD